MQNGLDKELEKQGLAISVMPTILIFTRRVTLQPEKIGRSIFLFSERQAETAHQQGEKRYPKTCKLKCWDKVSYPP